jgi:hypothetical protein
MIDTKTNIELMKISSNIIEVCDDRDEMTNSDFQGCLEAQVMNAYLLGKKEVSLSQSSVDFINNLLDNEYNTTDMDDEYRDEIQDVQEELDEIPVICKIKEEKL